MNAPLVHLAPFEKTDFYAWAGVESANPLITHTDHAIVIVDGCTLIVVVDPEEDGDAIEYGNIYGSEYLAITIGEAIAARIKSIQASLTPKEMADYVTGLATDCQLTRN
jgi:hypothetical protein